MDTPDPDVLDLRDYLQVLRRRWVTILLVTALTAGAAVGFSVVQTPIYQGTTELAIAPVQRSQDTSLQDLILGDTVVETERRVITSQPVTTRVIDDLQLGGIAPSDLADKIDVSVVTDTRVVNIRATDPDAAFAAQLSNAYADAYLGYRRDAALDELTAARGNLDARAEDLRGQIADLDDQLAQTDAPGTDNTGLQSQRNTLVQQLAQVEGQLSSIDQGSRSIRGGGEVLVPAEPGTSPISPKPMRTGVLALVLGMMLGVGLAFLRDYFDDGIRGEDDVRRVQGDMAMLGRITHWSDPQADERLMTLVDPHDQVSEEFRALSANVRFALVNRGAGGADPGSPYRQQSIAITSADAGEGKSTIAGNLAVAAASAGMHVLLVEADLRQPTLNGRFGVPAGVGVSDLLVDPELLTIEGQIGQYLVDVGIPRLRVLPAGTVPPNPTELLASPQMAWLHAHLTRLCDLVVYDTTPLLPVADTLEVTGHADTTLMVVRTGVCHRRELQRAVERLAGVGADFGGFVVNDVAVGKRSGYGYGYRYTSYKPRGGGSTPGRTAAGNGVPVAPQPTSGAWPSVPAARPDEDTPAGTGERTGPAGVGNGRNPSGLFDTPGRRRGDGDRAASRPSAADAVERLRRRR